MKLTLKRTLVVIATVWIFLCLLLIQLLFGERLFPRAQVVVSADRDVRGGGGGGGEGGPQARSWFADHFIVRLSQSCGC